MTISSRPENNPIGSRPDHQRRVEQCRHRRGGQRETRQRYNATALQLGAHDRRRARSAAGRGSRSRAGSSASASHAVTATSAMTIIVQVRNSSRSSTARIAVRPGDWKRHEQELQRQADGDEHRARQQSADRPARARRAGPSPARPGRSRGTAARSAGSAAVHARLATTSAISRAVCAGLVSSTSWAKTCSSDSCAISVRS